MFIPELTKNSNTSRDVIKRYIINKKLIKYECFECKITNLYNGKHITLHLDHINGIKNDNRLKNLRFLCPNCHSQTETYCGRNKGKGTKFCSCNNIKHYYALRCKDCNTKYRLNNSKKKIIWPELSYLINRAKEIGFLSLSRELGVSDNAIRKHIKKRSKVCCSTD